MSSPSISIIVPIFNEAGSIEELVKRISHTCFSAGIEYEIVAIDDNSADGSFDLLRRLSKSYNIRPFKKMGTKGKAYSLLQGFKKAKFEYIAMIDADLQYPPEEIPAMLEKLQKGSDIVVADRQYKNSSLKRRVFHHGFKLVFCKLLHGLECDVQSGLKVFKTEVLNKFKLRPTKWTFDLEFLLKSYYAGYRIARHNINFFERKEGSSKIRSIDAIREIGLAAIRIKLEPWKALPQKLNNSLEGFYYKGKKYMHHTMLHPKNSALLSVTFTQKIYITTILLVLILCFALNWHLTLVVLISILSILYFADLAYNFYLITRSFSSTSKVNITQEDIQRLTDDQLPMYTIFCPLYKEASVLPQFVEGIQNIDYPKDKLQVMLLLEEDDVETINAAKIANLPPYFEITVVPNSNPKTKPKACNYGLKLAKGEQVVIYDAEDIPDPQQLKKAFIAFQTLGDKVQCVQAKLNFYNPKQNVLTRLFTQEYSLWFELVLTGLQSMEAPIPLGGTSNHFRTTYLKKIKGWDAFNVTEDCDLGIRLVKHGYKTAIINSTTLEEANSNIGNWFNQRTRWLKGYMQTYLVHMRNANSFLKKNSFADFVYFQLVVGGKVLAILINPFMWILSIAYFAFRSTMGPFIESLFPTAIFYIAVFSMIAGNFVYFYNHMIAVAARGNYDLIKYAYLIPIYWLMMSLAGWSALFKLIYQPHHWFKTKHGLHLVPS